MSILSRARSRGGGHAARLRNACAIAVLALCAAAPALVTSHASASTLIGDVNNDCSVDALDLSLESRRFLIGIGSLLYSPTYDLNSDGVINVLDMQIVASHFLEHC